MEQTNNEVLKRETESMKMWRGRFAIQDSVAIASYNYLDLIKFKFRNQPQVYDAFNDILKVIELLS